MFRKASSQEWREIVASALAQAEIACWELVLETGELWWSENAGPLYGRNPGFVPAGFDEAQKLMDRGDERPVEMSAVLEGLMAGPVEAERRVIWPDGSTRWTHNRYFLMSDASGQPERLAGMITSIDDRKRRERDEALLNHANAILIGSLDLDLTLQSVAELLVPELADWCVVDLLEDEVLRPVARAHSDPEKLAWAAAIQEEYPPDMEATLGPPNVVRTGRPELYTEIPDELLVSVAEGDERLLEILREVGYRSVIVVPLTGRGGVIGTMTLVMSESDRTYDETSLVFAGRIGAQVAIAIETAQLHTSLGHAWQAEREAVDTLQHGLAPEPLPDIPGMTLAAHYEIGGSEKVGGDWYDVFSSEPGRVNFVIGDVVGRGVPAVAAMSRYRNILRTLLLEGHSPGRALTILNGFNNNEPSRGEGFATVACLEYRSADRVLSWSAAGHLPALIRDRNGVRGLWKAPGPPLDVQPGYAYTEEKVTLDPDAMLILYTDGLIERREEPIDRSLDRLVAEIASIPPDPETAVKHLLQVLPGHPSDDDVAVLVAQIG